jgi:hypothetical protein
MNRNIKYLIIGLIVCALCIPTALNATGNTIFSHGNGTVINERSIMVPNSSVLITLWEEQRGTGESIPYYSISLDGGKTIARTVQATYELGLRYAIFDPLKGEPAIIPLLTADNDVHLYIVQFSTQPLEEFQQAIITAGGIVRHYIAQYAYLVEMSEPTRTKVEQLPYVRWIGMYHPAYRLEEFMLDNIQNADQIYPLEQYNIQVLAVEQKTIVSERIRSIGGFVNEVTYRGDADSRSTLPGHPLG